jgi:hypothetical protein
MPRSDGHPALRRVDADSDDAGTESLDLLAAVRTEMDLVRRRLVELTSAAVPTARPSDPLPAPRLRQLKARITVAAGWGERRLATS